MLLAVATAFVFWVTPPVSATIGLAEWSLSTPGSNIVCSSDPFKAEHGTCLRTPEKPGVESKVCVSHIEWWQYHPGYVAGKTEKEFFLFRERDLAVWFEKSEAALLDRIKQLGVKPASGRRLTPKDGWELVWLPLMEQLKKQGQPRRSPGNSVPPPVEGPAAPSGSPARE